MCSISWFKLSKISPHLLLLHLASNGRWFLSWSLWCLKSSWTVLNEFLHFLHLYLNKFLCSLLKCLKLSICVPNCLVQPSCLQWYWGSLLALWVSFTCSSMLLALRNFLKQNLHGTLQCTLKCNLKFANVPNDFLHKSQMYLPVGPRMGRTFAWIAGVGWSGCVLGCSSWLDTTCSDSGSSSGIGLLVATGCTFGGGDLGCFLLKWSSKEVWLIDIVSHMLHTTWFCLQCSTRSSLV